MTTPTHRLPQEAELEAWSILYRGPLSSCNYACDYCPFAKTKNTRQELADDERRLKRFVDWVEAQAPRSIGILFTPWGEAIIRRYYQRALARLSRLSHVRVVAIQTNLSCKLDWVEDCDKDKLALWTTFHPTQISLDKFLEACRALDERQIHYSVGVVGFKEAFEQIEQLRAALKEDTYLWINAYKRDPTYYTEQDVARQSQIDPLFRYNTRYHPSQGRPCRAGHTSFSVDGDGVARRCHFIKTPIGNIYDADFAQQLAPKPCSNATCGCHIGYVHLNELELYDTFEGGYLERIPRSPQWLQRRDEVRAKALERLGPHPTTS